jgi:hypothetical protein
MGQQTVAENWGQAVHSIPFLELQQDEGGGCAQNVICSDAMKMILGKSYVLKSNLQDLPFPDSHLIQRGLKSRYTGGLAVWYGFGTKKTAKRSCAPKMKALLR